jgi:hypothetical protein
MLPQADGTLAPYVPAPARNFVPPTGPFQKRIAFAAAHVVCDPLAHTNPLADARLDWEATLAYRHYLWSWGLGVAEAMDTAQRGMGLSWALTQELIRRSVAEARALGGRIACGAGTDQLAPHAAASLAEIEAAYEQQCTLIESAGGQIILMASRALAACAQAPDDFVRVYERILSQASQPVIIHWLGEMFDPALAGYWGSRDLDSAMQVCLHVIRTHHAKIDGVKISLLDEQRELEMRRCLPPGVHMYSGDDFNYAQLIRGDERGYSDALLGIFDAIAPAASAALQALDVGDLQTYDDILAPTVELARHIFQPPTIYYKTGIVFMAYLNGHQSHFDMVGGLESARSIAHLSEIFRLAAQAGLLRDPEQAVERMRRTLALAGIADR